MNIHEYQAKEILRNAKVPVPAGKAVFTVPEAVTAAEEIFNLTNTNAIAVKAQIHAGGRGKGGGVKIASTSHLPLPSTSFLIRQQSPKSFTF